MVLLPVVGFSGWLFGQYLNARREEADAVMRRGLRAEAVVVGCRSTRRGAALHYRFTATGRDHPITASAHVSGRHAFTVGDTIAIRYLPAHPHISVVVPEGSTRPAARECATASVNSGRVAVSDPAMKLTGKE